MEVIPRNSSRFFFVFGTVSHNTPLVISHHRRGKEKHHVSEKETFRWKGRFHLKWNSAFGCCWCVPTAFALPLPLLICMSCVLILTVGVPWSCIVNNLTAISHFIFQTGTDSSHTVHELFLYTSMYILKSYIHTPQLERNNKRKNYKWNE